MNKLCLFISIVGLWTVTGRLSAQNLVQNPHFRISKGQSPEGWTHFTGQVQANPFQYNDAVLTIREAASNYVSSANIMIPLDGFKSYQWKVDLKLEKVKKQAAIFYYWTDADGRRITPERFLIKQNGTADWQTLTRIISPDDPAKTKGIRICLAIYHDPDSPGQVHYRYPDLRIADQTAAKPPEATANNKSGALPALSEDAFARKFNFTFKKSHEPYYKFAGVPGFLNISSAEPSRESASLTVQVPDAVELELLLLHGQSAQYQRRFEPKQVRQLNKTKIFHYQLPPGIIWNFVGNALFFNEQKKLQEYEILLDFEFADKSRNFQRKIPVKVRPPLPGPATVGDFKLYSWYSYPVLRLNLQEKTMGNNLLKLWQDCGFRGGNGALDNPDWTGYRDISKVFHYRHKNEISLPPSETPDGNPGPLACLSALNDLNSGFLEQMIANTDFTTGPRKPRLVYDYEPYAGGAGWVTRACFCTHCRKDFGQQENLPLLSAKEILTKYEKAWVRFRCRQRARFIQNIQTLIKKKHPPAEFYLCSMPLPPAADAERFFKEYGIDLKLCEPFVDGHMPMNYSPGLDFYHRQLQMALDLKKPLYPVLDNGWGNAFHYEPERSHGQILASAFMGIKGVYFGSGLMRMDADWLEMCHRAMTEISRFSPWLKDTRMDQQSWTLKKGLFAEGNLFSMTRHQKKTGTWLLFAVNNSPSQTAFAKLLPEQADGNLQTENYTVHEILSGRELRPSRMQNTFSKAELLRDGIPLQLPPFACRLLLCRPGSGNPASSLDNVDYASDFREAETRLHQQLTSQYKPRSEHGMSSRMLPEGLQLKTPAQNLLVHLEEGACATWSSGSGQSLAQIAKDWFVEPELLQLTENRAELLDLKFTPDELQAEFRYQIKEHTYEGLILRKRYILKRNTPGITVQIAIEPGHDYRPFRYRVSNLLNLDRDLSGNSFPDKIIYRVQGQKGDVVSRYGHAIFLHPDATFPEGKPFFARYAKTQTFTGNWLEAQHVISKNRLRAEFNGVDQLFLWRSGQHATMEWIYADPYPDRDPHKVRTWQTEFKLYSIGEP